MDGAETEGDIEIDRRERTNGDDARPVLVHQLIDNKQSSIIDRLSLLKSAHTPTRHSNQLNKPVGAIYIRIAVVVVVVYSVRASLPYVFNSYCRRLLPLLLLTASPRLLLMYVCCTSTYSSRRRSITHRCIY